MPSYCLELKLKVKKDSDRNYLQNYFNAVAKLGNEIRRFAIRQLGHLKQDKNYKSLLAEYVKVKGDKDSPERERLSKELSVIVGSYGLTKYGLQKSACQMRKHLKYVHSDVYQKLSDSIWRSVEKYLYGNGKQIHFKKWDDVMSFENKKKTPPASFMRMERYTSTARQRNQKEELSSTSSSRATKNPPTTCMKPHVLLTGRNTAGS